MRSLVMRGRPVLRCACMALAALTLHVARPHAIRSQSLASYAVIVHADAPAAGMAFGQLRRMYRGDQQYWPDGTKVVVLIQRAGSEEREAVLRSVFRLSEGRYKEFWITRIFRGDVTSAPKVVRDSHELIELVRNVPGAIGIVRREDVPAGMRITAIDGKLPGDGGYALD
jgi:hypothetical protein